MEVNYNAGCKLASLTAALRSWRGQQSAYYIHKGPDFVIFSRHENYMAMFRFLFVSKLRWTFDYLSTSGTVNEGYLLLQPRKLQLNIA